MAKRKMSAEEVTTVPPEHVNVQVVVEVPSSEPEAGSSTTQETVQAVPVSSKMKFRQLGGYHYQGEVKYGPGDIVESEDDLVLVHGANKFEQV